MYGEIKSMFDLRQFAIQQVAIAKKGKVSAKNIIQDAQAVADFIRGGVPLPEYVPSIDPLDVLIGTLNRTPHKPEVLSKKDQCN